MVGWGSKVRKRNRSEDRLKRRQPAKATCRQPPRKTKMRNCRAKAWHYMKNKVRGLGHARFKSRTSQYAVPKANRIPSL